MKDLLKGAFVGFLLSLWGLLCGTVAWAIINQLETINK